MAQKPSSYLPPTPAPASAAKAELDNKAGLGQVADWIGTAGSHFQ